LVADSTDAEAVLPADAKVSEACEIKLSPVRDMELAALPTLSVALTTEADAALAMLAALASAA